MSRFESQLREYVDRTRNMEEMMGNLESKLRNLQDMMRLSNKMEKKIKIDLLSGKFDRFGGVIIDGQLPNDCESFKKSLEESIRYWKKQEKRGLWLKISIEQSHLIPIAVEHQFVFHHAERDYVMLTAWLPEEECKLPDYASHTIGIGGFVLNDQNQVLVISEKYAETKMWKLPGGYVKEGETLHEAAIREVKEETGVDTSFLSIVCFRHIHPLQFLKSDIYFIARLHPLSFELHPEESEIMDCQWMDLHEYMHHPNVNEYNKKVARVVSGLSPETPEGFRIHKLDNHPTHKNVFDVYLNQES